MQPDYARLDRHLGAQEVALLRTLLGHMETRGILR